MKIENFHNDDICILDFNYEPSMNFLHIKIILTIKNVNDSIIMFSRLTNLGVILCTLMNLILLIVCSIK